MPRKSDAQVLRSGAQVIRRRWAVIAAAVVVAATAAFVLSVSTTSVYTADVEVLIAPRGADDVRGERAVSLDERAVRTEIRVIESEAVRSLVAADLGLDEEPPPASARAVDDTDVVSIAVRSPNAASARSFAEAYADAYVEFRREQAVTQLLSASTEVEGVISELTERIDGLSEDDPARESAESQRATFSATLDQLRVDAALQTGGVAVIEPASIPDAPSDRSPLTTTTLAALAGLLIGLVAAFVLERLDDKVRSPEQLETLTDEPLLGLIPVDPPAGQSPLALAAYGRPSVEAYRDLRTNLCVRVGDRPLSVIQITSALPGEGKTTTATNLAVVLAQAGHRVALVDADLRNPGVHDAFALPRSPGVTDLLSGGSPKDTVHHVHVGAGERLSIYTSGALPPNPSELLSGRLMRKLLTRLGERYDFVVLDSVPVLPVTDSVVLAHAVEGVIMVSRAGSVTQPDVERALGRLARVDAHVVGLVLNQAPATGFVLADYGPDSSTAEAADVTETGDEVADRDVTSADDDVDASEADAEVGLEIEMDDDSGAADDAADDSGDDSPDQGSVALERDPELVAAERGD